jgi:hypothetical protein
MVTFILEIKIIGNYKLRHKHITIFLVIQL